MIVTVQETIEHSRDITAEMVEAYISKRGWAYHETSQLYRWYNRADSPTVAIPIIELTPWLGGLKSTITFIARYVECEPHLVLADIAEGK